MQQSSVFIWVKCVKVRDSWKGEDESNGVECRV